MFSTATQKLLHLQDLNRQLNTKCNGRMTRQGGDIQKLLTENLNKQVGKEKEIIGIRESKLLSLEIRASIYEPDENPYFLLDEQQCRGGYTRKVRGNNNTGEIREQVVNN